MACTDIQKPFAKSFSEIENLVDEQIRKIKGKKLSVTVRAWRQMIIKIWNSRHPGIVLVGGLGSSPYLYEHLKRNYGGKKFDVLQSTGIKP